MRPRWGFIGCGNLAQALISGAISRKYLAAHSILAHDASSSKLKIFSRKMGIAICHDNVELVKKCDFIFLATKPQDIKGALREIAPHLDHTKTVISLAAGVSAPFLRAHLHRAGTLARVMGNTPALIQQGFFGIYIFKKSPGRRSKHAARELVAFFDALGETALVKNDKQIDAITAASASGVGFVFMFMEQFSTWLMAQQFSATEARRVSVKTFLGAAMMAEAQSAVKLSALREKVTSKKGTTLAGLTAMKKAKVGPGLKSGLSAAGQRSGAIAKSLLKSSK